MERGKEVYAHRVRARLLLHDVEPTIRPVAYWPDGPSVYDLMQDITAWLNANGIRAMDVPVGEVAQLHDGQITVWTFDRPRRVENDEVMRRLITVPMVVAPPDSIQPWLRGQCRESLPFAAPEPSEADIEEHCRCHVVRMPPCTWCESGGTESPEPVTFAVDVSRDGTTGVAATAPYGHLMIVDETHHISPEEMERFAARFLADDVARAEEHFRRFYLNEPVSGEPDGPPVDAALQEPDRREPEHVTTQGAGRFHTDQNSQGEWFEVPCDCPEDPPARRPWWRFW
jgi:hypothetical protein